MSYVVTLDEFKLYFLREAGLEYQPYPSWVKTVYDFGAKVNHNGSSWESAIVNNTTEPGAEDAEWSEIETYDDSLPAWFPPVSYDTNDKVIYVVNYKPGVWKSKIDDNYTEPGTDSTKWALDEDATADLSDVVLDADIERAMGEAAFKFNKNLFSEPKGKLVFLYLSMFFLVYDKQMASSGLNGNSASGPVIHRTVGKMSVTYMESKLFAKYPSYEFLASNDYGRKAFNLMAPYLRGNVSVFNGAATGE